MRPEEHRSRVKVAGFGRDRRFEATCSCGWVAPTRRSSEAVAERDYDDHILAVSE